MPGLQLSGLASGFDWKTFTDSVMEMERAPARRYEAEQAKNDNKKSQLSSLGTKLSSLKTAMTALGSSSLSSGRKVVNESSSAAVQATVSSSTPVGSYEVQVIQLAKASRLKGTEFIADPVINKTDELKLRGSDTGEWITITPSKDDMTVFELVAAINSSKAGITAITNRDGTQIVLSNQFTGENKDICVEGSLVAKLGLTDATLTHGESTKFTINGLEFTSLDTTLNSEDHSIAGLSLKVDAAKLSQDDPAMASAEILTVSADASGMRAKIDDFVSTYNAVADFIDSSSAYSTIAGKTTAGLLADNREIQIWLKQLRSTAFSSPTYGKIKNLSTLGLDFPDRNSSRIKVIDETKLDAALNDNASDVAKFFNNQDEDSPGLATVFQNKLKDYVGWDGSSGQLSDKLKSYSKANASLDTQIASLDRYLAQRRSQLEAGFMAMESAQSKMTQMQTQLTNAFGQKK